MRALQFFEEHCLKKPLPQGCVCVCAQQESLVSAVSSVHGYQGISQAFRTHFNFGK